MPLVFVHGVNVRYEETDKNVQLRNSLFKRYLLKELFTEPEKVKIFNPFWGGDGVKFAWGMASLPRSEVEELGPEDELPAILLEQFLESKTVDQDTILLQVARQSLTDAIDLLWAAVFDGAGELEGDKLADLAVQAIDYADHHPSPDWLNEVDNDQQFLGRFKEEINSWQSGNKTLPEATGPQWESLGGIGGWDQVREGAERIRDAFPMWISKGILHFQRHRLNEEISTFMGDVLVYLKERGSESDPGSIVKKVVGSLEQAQEARTDDDNKLIVVAHSMGGNIVYDILTHFRPDIEVDWFISVGSQVAMFEEMKLFHVSKKGFPTNSRFERVDKPEKIRNWLNIFDYSDILSFSTESVFSGVKDLSYSTGKGLLGAHGNYFNMPSFHERLRMRIQKTGR